MREDASGPDTVKEQSTKTPKRPRRRRTLHGAEEEEEAAKHRGLRIGAKPPSSSGRGDYRVKVLAREGALPREGLSVGPIS